MKWVVVFLMIFSLYGAEFRNLIVVSPKMNINKIINILENVKDHTVIRFENGYYDFHYNKVMINNKISVAIEGGNGTHFSNLSLQVTNGNNIVINYIQFENGDIRFLNDNNLALKHFIFEESNLVIDNSQVILYKVLSLRDYNQKIVIHNSNVNIGYSKILDNNSLVIEATSSNIGLFQNRLGMTKFILSNVRVLENKFAYNNNLLKTYFLVTIRSVMDAIGNEFMDNYGAILVIHSKAHIERNFFINIKYFIDIEDKSVVSLLKNKSNTDSQKVIKNSTITHNKSLLMANLYGLRSLFDKLRFDIDYSGLKKVK